jgi:hypothetical protein
VKASKSPLSKTGKTAGSPRTASPTKTTSPRTASPTATCNPRGIVCGAFVSTPCCAGLVCPTNTNGIVYCS